MDVRRSESELDKALGMEYYVSVTEGIGGTLRKELRDFIVEEITLDGKLIPTSLSPEPLPIMEVEPGPYTWFIMEKEGMGSVEAIRSISKELAVKLNMFSFAGLKDSRAITSQFVCVLGVPPESLSRLSIRRIRIRGAFTWPRPLRVGELCGNRFRITISDVGIGMEEALDRLDSIIGEVGRAGGFPAYYGYQRFGTRRPNTHVVGRMLLKGDVEGAVREYLGSPFPSESRESYEARKFLEETWDYRGALPLFPKRLAGERMVIKYLIKSGGDHLGALRRLPLTTRRLFVEAYQAYLFNRILSSRMGRGIGLNEPVCGDLICMLDRRGLPTRATVLVTQYNLDRARELIGRGRAAIVHRVPGYDYRPRAGEPGEAEAEVMEGEGISAEDFKIRYMPEASARGTSRPCAFVAEGLRLLPVDGHRRLSLEFTLRRGMYATVVLRELMKPMDPATSGF